MTTRRTDRDVAADRDVTADRDTTVNKPYRRAEPQPASNRATWTGPVPEGTARGVPPSPAPEVSAGRMSTSDRISGGPIWSGFIISFAVWIFLEIVLVAAGLSQIQAG